MPIDNIDINEYDWVEAFKYVGTPSVAPGSYTSNATFTRDDVVEILHAVDGCNEGPDWVGVFFLQDGRYACLRAGCDYTGWDCQAFGSADVADSYDQIARFGLTAEERQRLGLVIGGTKGDTHAR